MKYKIFYNLKGGPNTLETVKEAISENVPILVLAVRFFVDFNLIENL
jgi:hypothetical protein